MDGIGVLAEAFSGTGALERDGRLALARVLMCRPAELDTASLGDLTDTRHRRRLCTALSNGAEAEPVRERWSDSALTDLFPAAARLGDGDVLCRGAPRLLALLGRERAHRWPALLALRIGEIEGWTNAEPKTVAEVVGVAFERSLVGVLRRAGPSREADTVADLATVLRQQPGAAAGTVRAALAALVDGGAPAEVSSAAARVLLAVEGVTTSPAAQGQLQRALADVLEAAGAARDIAVFVDRELAVRDRRTGVQLQRRLRVSPERVRQLRVRAADRVRAAAAGAGPEIAEMAGNLRHRLGSVVPMACIEEEVVRAGVGTAASDSGLLALWLAGPYRAVAAAPGWVSTDPDTIRTRTLRLLSEDGGARLIAEVREELAALGVVRGHRDGWIWACGAVLVDDMVVSTDGTLDDVLERLLFALGRPATAGELASLLAGSIEELEVRRRLDRARRFASVEGGAFELTEWRAATAPGPGCHPAPRRAGTPATPSGTPSIGGRLWLKVRVDPGVLGGASVPAPAELAEAVGIGAHQRQTFAGHFGPVTLANDPPGPVLVSLRPIALAAAASAGDTLTLGFGAQGELTVRLASDEPIAGEGVTLLSQPAEEVV